MLSTQGDFCPHACVHGGQLTVIFSVSAGLSQNAWICARRSTNRDLESVSARFSCERLDMSSSGKRP